MMSVASTLFERASDKYKSYIFLVYVNLFNYILESIYGKGCSESTQKPCNMKNRDISEEDTQHKKHCT